MRPHRLPGRSLAFDLGAAGVLFLVLLVPAGGMGPVETALLAVLCAALAIRRIATGWALAVAWLGAIIQMLALLGPSAVDLPILGVLYATAAYGGRVVRWAGLGSVALGALVAAFYTAIVLPMSTPGVGVGAGQAWLTAAFHAVSFLGLLGLAWTLGLLARTARAARQGRLQAAVERERARYEVAVEHERGRIARDMHDVVAHSLAVVIAQADGARYAAAARPEAQTEALDTIATTARGALAEVRLLLSELRHSAGGSPQPALADLVPLIDRFRSSGLDLRRSEQGEPVPLGAGREIAAYRITQEALTNALRHGAPGSAVLLNLDWRPDGLALRVENPIGGDGEPGPAGHGLPGMQERAALVGGSLRAAPDGEHFVVDAFIPVTPSEALS